MLRPLKTRQNNRLRLLCLRTVNGFYKWVRRMATRYWPLLLHAILNSRLFFLIASLKTTIGSNKGSGGHLGTVVKAFILACRGVDLKPPTFIFIANYHPLKGRDETSGAGLLILHTSHNNHDNYNLITPIYFRTGLYP